MSISSRCVQVCLLTRTQASQALTESGKSSPRFHWTLARVRRRCWLLFADWATPRLASRILRRSAFFAASPSACIARCCGLARCPSQLSSGGWLLAATTSMPEATGGSIFVRSLGLDTLTARERRSLELGGNAPFCRFLAGPECNVSRRVWLALPPQTRYHTPAADLYRRRLKAALDAEQPAVDAEENSATGGGGLSMDPAVRPPPPSRLTPRETPPRWTANRDAPRCQLCKAEFHLLNWRHHCRKCGRCVCAECSPTASWRPMPEFFGTEEPTRHCKCAPRDVPCDAPSPSNGRRVRARGRFSLTRRLCVAPTQLMPGM